MSLTPSLYTFQEPSRLLVDMVLQIISLMVRDPYLSCTHSVCRAHCFAETGTIQGRKKILIIIISSAEEVKSALYSVKGEHIYICIRKDGRLHKVKREKDGTNDVGRIRRTKTPRERERVRERRKHDVNNKRRVRWM